MTDPELIELLAKRGMGWQVFPVSHHRTGTRPLPHAWRWRKPSGVRLMVFDGKSNREWNPLEKAEDAAELASAGGETVPEGMSPREYATAVGERLKAAQQEANEDIQG